MNTIYRCVIEAWPNFIPGIGTDRSAIRARQSEMLGGVGGLASGVLIRHVFRRLYNVSVTYEENCIQAKLSIHSIIMGYGGHSRIRTYDFHRVKVALYR
jgi:hypothetical protein